MPESAETVPSPIAWPAEVRFGEGVVADLPAVLSDLGVERPLLVTDPGIVECGLAERVANLLTPAHDRFTGIEVHPSIADVVDGVALCREGGHDGVVAVGGGSALDVGKAIAFACRQQRPLAEFALAARTDGEPEAVPAAPWVAVPTTAGTGSEVSPTSVLTDPDTGCKRSIGHSAMLAPAVLCDPMLTLGLPPRLTAWTGMDALSHCLEAWLVPEADEWADARALEGLRRIRRSLARAFHDGDDAAARADLLAASTLGALAFRKGLGAVHAVGHALSARFGTPHGLVNAVLLPHVVRFNRDVSRDRLRRLADALGLEAQDRACPVTAWLVGLRAELGIPHTLAALDIDWDEAELRALGEAAAADANAATNPVPLTACGARELLEAARGGR
jgi:alcohol dehydrogenase class IV